MMEERIKCVVVGDYSAGTTCLILSFINKWKRIPEYIPCSMEKELVRMEVDGRESIITLWPTACPPDYDSLRPLLYPDTDVFLVCFSLVDPESYENVYEKWYPELQRYSPHTPIVLVGTKHDLCGDHETLRNLRMEQCAPLTWHDGIRLSNDIGAFKYVEFSACNQTVLEHVFAEAVRAARAGNVTTKTKL